MFKINLDIYLLPRLPGTTGTMVQGKLQLWGQSWQGELSMRDMRSGLTSSRRKRDPSTWLEELRKQVNYVTIFMEDEKGKG
jgi:hypothetical protein